MYLIQVKLDQNYKKKTYWFKKNNIILIFFK
jgi:hypothetical protein